jgi:hypothetical protein
MGFIPPVLVSANLAGPAEASSLEALGRSGRRYPLARKEP